MQRLIFMSILMLISVSCAAPGNTPTEKKATIENMRMSVLNEIYTKKPAVRALVNKSPGYAVFSNVNVNLLFISAGSGYGVAVNNNTGNKTYMKMGEAGIGFGAGVKDFRALFVFDTKQVMDNFIKYGWQVGANADAAAKAGDKGGAVGKETVMDGITVYQLTENGVALQATIKGAKFWVDGDLN
ncbi:MAG: hypothetical protein HKP09_05400 [Enterobacterales bacterium]|nr:hypothetical protein [Enterobacterales bacterium]